MYLSKNEKNLALNMLYLITQTICLLSVYINLFGLFYVLPELIANTIAILFVIPFFIFYIMGQLFVILAHPIYALILCIIKFKNHDIKIKDIIIFLWSTINTAIYLYLIHVQGFLLTV